MHVSKHKRAAFAALESFLCTDHHRQRWDMYFHTSTLAQLKLLPPVAAISMLDIDQCNTTMGQDLQEVISLPVAAGGDTWCQKAGRLRDSCA